MIARLFSLLAGTAAVFVLSVASANQPSHNVPGEKGYAFHDARGDSRATERDLQRACLGWRLVRGEAVWLYERRAKCIDEQRSGASGETPMQSNRPVAENTQIQNSIYHGA